MQPGLPEPNYPALFKRYILRSVRVAHTRLPTDGALLADEGRERALHVLSFALQLPAAWPDVRDLLLGMAPKMEQAGHRDDWIPFLQQGLHCSQQHNDRLATAELQWQIGHLYRLQSRFELARQTLEASAAEFAALGRPGGEVRVWNELAYLAWHQQRYAEAQRLAKAALACLDEAEPERAVSLSVLGLIAISWRDWQAGENYFKEALQIRTAHGDQQRMAWNMQHLGNVLRYQGNYTQATIYYEKAIQALTEIQDSRNRAIIQMEFGILYSLTQQSNRALDLYTSAESYFRKSQDYLYLAKVMTNIGLEYITLCEWKSAIQTFADSAALYEKLNNIYGYLNALDGLGIAYGGLGSYDKAIVVFESALSQLALIQDDPSTQLLGEELTTHLEQAKEKIGRRFGAP